MPEVQPSKDLIFVSLYFIIAMVPTHSKNASLYQEEKDLPYEEEILRHPYQVKCWIRYIQHKSAAPKAIINLIYERALKELPGRCIEA